MNMQCTSAAQEEITCTQPSSPLYPTLTDLLKQWWKTFYLTCISNEVERVNVVETNILLPGSSFEKNYLQLPLCSSRCMNIDHYLNSHPSIASRNKELLSRAPRRLASSFSGENVCRDDDVQHPSILNLCQGEVAHSTSSQCDVIASGDTTTCHIVAIRSSLGTEIDSLTSLAHIDKTCYESCLRNIVDTHKKHHNSKSSSFREALDEEKEGSIPYSKRLIDMDLHLMGGFNDSRGHSREISSFLLYTFQRIAEEEKYAVRITLRTCAISSMNDTGFSSPIGRGLGISTRSGETFLAYVDESVAGPALELRSCRLWTEGYETLLLIHEAQVHINRITISPFHYEPFDDIDYLLNIPNDSLLQYCSTTPESEAENFCNHLRKTFLFMKNVKCQYVFGKDCNTPLTYQRILDKERDLNSWIKVDGISIN